MSYRSRLVKACPVTENPETFKIRGFRDFTLCFETNLILIAPACLLLPRAGLGTGVRMYY